MTVAKSVRMAMRVTKSVRMAMMVTRNGRMAMMVTRSGRTWWWTLPRSPLSMGSDSLQKSQNTTAEGNLKLASCVAV